METFKSFEESLYHVNAQSFDEIALKLFRFQALHNPVYAEYIHYLGIVPEQIDNILDIPYLPVGFFKTHTIMTGDWKENTVFTSSGTTGTSTSRHFVYNLDFYLQNAARCFSHFYGHPSKYKFLALLPSYAEREGSSLIAMIEEFIRIGGGGFYHRDKDALIDLLRKHSKNTILWGVSYALLDLAEERELDLSGCIVFETGGMKGRRKEITRPELHGFLNQRFHTSVIHSEYGMTELMSQAYSEGNGVFFCPPSMKVVLRDPEDPMDMSSDLQRGGINIIDLANFHTCAFIETQDLGKLSGNGGFEVLGRMDNSDIRGCNLMVE